MAASSTARTIWDILTNPMENAKTGVEVLYHLANLNPEGAKYAVQNNMLKKQVKNKRTEEKIKQDNIDANARNNALRTELGLETQSTPAPTNKVNTPNNTKAVPAPTSTPAPTVAPRNVQAVTPPTSTRQTTRSYSSRRKAVANPVAKKTETTTVTRTPEQQTAYEQMMEASKNLSAKLHDYANGILPQPTETDERLREIARGYGFLPPEPSVTALQNAADNAVADTLYSQLLQPQARQYGFNAMPQTAPSVVNGLDELAFELGLQPSLRQGPSLADLYTESQLVNPAVLGINDLLGGVS